MKAFIGFMVIFAIIFSFSEAFSEVADLPLRRTASDQSCGAEALGRVDKSRGF